MAGGKGGTQTSQITIPDYIEDAARRNLAKAEGMPWRAFQSRM